MNCRHLGLGTDLSGPPWALFSTYGGGGLYARTSSGAGAPIDTPIPGDWLGGPHSFRVEWTEAGVVFSIDGAVVASHDTVLSAALRPVVSDYQAGGGAVTVDSLSLLP